MAQNEIIMTINKYICSINTKMFWIHVKCMYDENNGGMINFECMIIHLKHDLYIYCMGFGPNEKNKALIWLNSLKLNYYPLNFPTKYLLFAF